MRLTKSIAFVLLCCFSFQLSAKAIWFGYYHLNKNNFIRNFCVNQAVPKSTCEAKCFLKKQAKQEQESQQQLPGFVKEKESTESDYAHAATFNVHLSLIKRVTQPYTYSYAFLGCFSIFHPPQ